MDSLEPVTPTHPLQFNLNVPEPDFLNCADEPELLDHLKHEALEMLALLEEDCLGTHKDGIKWLLFQVARSLQRLRTDYDILVDPRDFIAEFEPYFGALTEEFEKLKVSLATEAQPCVAEFERLSVVSNRRSEQQ